MVTIDEFENVPYRSARAYVNSLEKKLKSLKHQQTVINRRMKGIGSEGDKHALGQLGRIAEKILVIEQELNVLDHRKSNPIIRDR